MGTGMTRWRRKSSVVTALARGEGRREKTTPVRGEALGPGWLRSRRWTATRTSGGRGGVDPHGPLEDATGGVDLRTDERAAAAADLESLEPRRWRRQSRSLEPRRQRRVRPGRSGRGDGGGAGAEEAGCGDRGEGARQRRWRWGGGGRRHDPNFGSLPAAVCECEIFAKSLDAP